MKNLFLFLFLTLLISCNEEETSIAVVNQKVSVQLSFPEKISSGKPFTKSLSARQRIIVEVYWLKNSDEMELSERKVLVPDDLSEPISIDFTMQLSQSYHLLFWSDVSNAAGDDVYYSTDKSLIEVTSLQGENNYYSGDPQNRDAFFASTNVKMDSEQEVISVILSRACGVIKVDAKDLHDASLKKIPHISILKLSAPSIFNVSTGEMTSDEDFEVHYTIPDDKSNNEVLSFYFPSPRESTLNTIKFEFYDSTNTSIATKEFSNLPIRRNTRTILNGNIFTSNLNVDLTFDSNFSNPENENDNIVFGNSANSFILHPSSKPVKYSIPVTHQNEYWGSIKPSNVISESTKWNTHIIWSELNEGDFLIQASNLPLYTDIVVNPKAKGNALIGVYNDMNANDVQDEEEPFLWSYHLWITEYNPDQSISIASDKYDYMVSGGKVQRIPGDKWNGASYSSARLMDRNLGELSTNYSDERSGVLFFQYGRKDPFPLSLIANKECNSTSSIQYSIYNPNLLYTKEYLQSSKKVYRWTDDNIGSGYIWSDLSSKDKSIFDPCPYGWSLPTHQDLADIVLLSKTEIENYITYGDIIQFRKCGFLGASLLELNETSNFLLCSDIDAEKNNNPYVLNIKDSKFSDIFRSTGLPVRCIKRN